MLPFGFDQYIAWMSVDLPRLGEAGKDGSTVLYSDPCSNYYDAEEKVAESVLEYYQSNRKIEINDFNQDMLKKKQYELDISNFFCQAFEDKINEMRAYPGTYSTMSTEQFYSEAFQDTMTDLIKERTTETNQCKAVHRRITDVCRSFSDILPIKETQLPKGSTDSGGTQLSFAGEEDNPSRVDQLALLLLDILRDGHIHAAKHGRSMHCKYSSSVLQGKNNFDPLSYDSTYVTLSFSTLKCKDRSSHHHRCIIPPSIGTASN